ncbi:hypothetical protein CONLIGDRAFT_650371 [Coniochaeta ligniaria NRRL 30616]|uniref:2EXR domain-containing protein n=1 Tax=Coniochaeta ligniaria NRRL 30616 TaxID=1408157 RepID=A0A1J7IYN1_9PEZI|nr:hypothetical protein CONLIGDRAFT_650371 [Coniochaeta ligniaria NRRL 30616]
MDTTVHSNFPRFISFPLEIREMIWEDCLPHRVIDMDMPTSESQTPDIVPEELWSKPFCSWTDSRQWWAHASCPPLIARVCRESRRVALRNGQWLPVPSYDPLWLDPARDVLHLNWNTYVDRFHYPFTKGIITFLAKAPASRVSITDNLTNALPFSRFNDWADEEAQDEDCEPPIPDQLEQRRSYEVCLGTVIIHVTGTEEERRDRIIESGLFGFFGEKQVEIVDATDRAKLQHFAIFNETCGSPLDVRATYFFQNYQTDYLEERKQGHERRWLNYRLAEARKKGTAIEDLDTVRVPMPGPGRCSNQWMPNRGHPWVKSVLCAMPTFHPVYMIRVCTNGCT